jgi:hypothetical protein
VFYPLREEDPMPGRISRSMNDVKEMLRQKGLYLVEAREDIEKMIEVMVRFYSDDDLFKWLCGGEYDEATTANIMRAGVFSMPNAIAYADSTDFNAVAVWIPPGNKNLPIVSYLKNGGFELIRQGGLGMVYRLLSYQGYASKMHKSITYEGDWYLFSYAVDPDLNCDEFSEKILRPITELSWETGESCYSEVTSDRGINIMRAAGFQVRDQGQIPGSRVTYYGVMV